jgi:outer membrane protein assembly factor BamA
MLRRRTLTLADSKTRVSGKMLFTSLNAVLLSRIMRRAVLLPLAALAVLVSVRPLMAQKFLPKSIQFQGAPEYSSKELLAATGLKKGVVLGYTDMQNYSKRLMDSGVFAQVAFKFDGQDLIFLLTPSTDLVPARLENLPLAPGEGLDATLHDQVPLYHGKVPADGGLTEGVRAALEKILAGQGLQATVIQTTAGDLRTQKVNAVIYSIATPPVQFKVVHLDGVSAPNQGNVASLASEAEKAPFDTTDSTNNLERVVEQFYNDKGYAAVKVHAAPSGTPSMDSGSIVVPFSLRVDEGKVYEVKSIQLPSGIPVTQAEVDKILAPTAEGPAQGVRVRSIWVLISSRYKSKGYLDCKVTPHAKLDEAAGTVGYTVDVDPGPVYHLGFVRFDNVSDDLRTLLIHNWQMMPGDPFDESYVANFITIAQKQDPVLRRSLAGVKAKFDATADPRTHEVNVVIRLER